MSSESVSEDEARKAWELFVKTGRDDLLRGIRPEIRESWKRSRMAGVSPSIAGLPLVLDSAAISQKYLENARLISAASEVMLSVCEKLKAHSFLVQLTDADGNVLSNYSSRPEDKRAEMNAVPGAGIQETTAGTTSPALALRLDRPMRVTGHEFYAAFLHDWTGYAAPIHSACRHLLGALTIAAQGRTGHEHAPELLNVSAKSVEEALTPFDQSNLVKILEEFNRCLLRYSNSPLFAVCPHGRILALSPNMAGLISSQSPETLIGRPVRDAQDFQIEESFLSERFSRLSPYEATVSWSRKDESCQATVIPVHAGDKDNVGMVLVLSPGTKGVPLRRTKASSSWGTVHSRKNILGAAPSFLECLHLLERAAKTDWPVFLAGESGTGKELFAQAIHDTGVRSHGPFVPLNLSTIPKELLASELFGYDEGAFSGAARGGKRGKIELAHGGTLFLDELTDLPLDMQSALLRILEDKKVVPLGSDRPRTVVFRVIAATNLKPASAVADGKLRLDLYYRLNVLFIELPPLRERLEDLPLLVRHILDREGFAGLTISEAVMDAFRQYSWPGNIRELRNVLVRAAAVSVTATIVAENLPAEVRSGFSAHRNGSGSSPDRIRVEQALAEALGNISRAAQILGIHRTTLHHKIREYGLARERFMSSRAPS